MKSLYIFDLDGTLALIDHRRWILDTDAKNKWDTFYMACPLDAPNLPVIRVMSSLQNSGADVWIWSGRGEIARASTLEWLALHTEWTALGQYRQMDNLGGYTIPCEPEFRMRPLGDMTSDDFLKFSWLQAMRFSDRQRLVAVFDDREKVVQMWRKCGVACFQTTNGKF